MSSRIAFWMMFALLAFSTVTLRRLSHGESTPPRQALASLPLQLGSWSGRDDPIQRRIVNALAVDDYLSRTYDGGQEAPVVLYIGYYKSQRTGQTIHSPKNCLPGAGWEPVRSGRADLLLPGGRHIEVNDYVVQKGVEQQLVIYWYQSHGRAIASEYWSKYYMVVDALRLNRTDAALIRISTPIYPDEATAEQRAGNFAGLIATRVEALIPNQ